MTTILILAANPGSATRLWLDQEVRDIGAALTLAKLRDRFKLITQWAVRPKNLQQALIDTDP